ncbi:MAG TPA: hypothetical protein VLT84_06010 [Acidobacteriota bacterium]|nr:hypothetical protein [Acidobacteriota bacterium]
MRAPTRSFRRRLGIAGLAFLALAGLAGAQELVQTGDPAHPRLRDADAILSLNDRCAVRQGSLNPTYAPVYVNGKPIGFC